MFVFLYMKGQKKDHQILTKGKQDFPEIQVSTKI